MVRRHVVRVARAPFDFARRRLSPVTFLRWRNCPFLWLELRTSPENVLYSTAAVENGNNLQRLGFRAIDD
jgi:hypothetical protein